jgi:DNA-binding transcriptional regulator YiaG
MMKFKELCEAANMSITELARFMNIPYKTAQKWANEERQPPVYVIELIQYKLMAEGIIKE